MTQAYTSRYLSLLNLIFVNMSLSNRSLQLSTTSDSWLALIDRGRNPILQNGTGRPIAGRKVGALRLDIGEEALNLACDYTMMNLPSQQGVGLKWLGPFACSIGFGAGAYLRADGIEVFVDKLTRNAGGPPQIRLRSSVPTLVMPTSQWAHSLSASGWRGVGAVFNGSFEEAAAKHRTIMPGRVHRLGGHTF